MELLKELDEKATQQRVKTFFCKELPRLISASDKTPANIQSPTISDMPTSHSYGNSNELSMTEYVNANMIVDEVVCALNGMANEEFSKMLKYKYIFGLTYFEVSQRMNMSERQMYRRFDEAYVQFAYSFRVADLKVESR